MVDDFVPTVSEHGSDKVTPAWFGRNLKLGDSGEDVRVVQLLLHCEPTGCYDSRTSQKVRGFRIVRNLDARGGVDEVVAQLLGELQ